MTTPPRQLTLDWPHQPSFAREDFLVAASNREALFAIERWPDWPGRMLLLVGPEGSGKSHLAALWTQASGAAAIQGGELVTPLPVASGALLIEDADRMGAAEEQLFHLLNAALQADAWVLLTARAGPETWGLRTPDLLSRLRLAPVARVGAPDRELTEAVLYKLFSDRQLQVEPHVITYVAMRMERSLAAAQRLVAMLDQKALAKGRRVTRSMAGELLREMTPRDKSS